ncbi:MAG: T9SS type A sorting domain-containing protein, partial [Prolixibacteraceae bacterium]|nr:T9SS type A sorting domain-containing protein [Prolixibacteraceae bacterium]
GKMVSAKFTVEVKIPTGLKTIPNKQQITIWPNPTNGMIYVVLDQNPQPKTELIIMDSSGKIALRQNIRKEENQIDLSGLPRGQYLVKTNEKGTNAQKIILK